MRPALAALVNKILVLECLAITLYKGSKCGVQLPLDEHFVCRGQRSRGGRLNPVEGRTMLRRV